MDFAYPQKKLEQLELEQSPQSLFSLKGLLPADYLSNLFALTSKSNRIIDIIADKNRRKWGKIGLARLTFLSLGRRIDYESGTSKSRLHHDLRVSFSQKRMLKRKTKGKQSKNDRMKKGKMVSQVVQETG